jgi:hypothetical protein
MHWLILTFYLAYVMLNLCLILMWINEVGCHTQWHTEDLVVALGNIRTKRCELKMKELLLNMHVGIKPYDIW